MVVRGEVAKNRPGSLSWSIDSICRRTEEKGVGAMLMVMTVRSPASGSQGKEIPKNRAPPVDTVAEVCKRLSETIRMWNRLRCSDSWLHHCLLSSDLPS